MVTAWRSRPETSFGPAYTLKISIDKLRRRSPRSACSKGKDVFGIAGNDALGCIAIYTATSDEDDTVRTYHWGRRDVQ
jgi:hypothetical protein